jgi:hypothetical protein
MKRDMDLVRSIVLAIEEAPNGYAPNPLDVPGHTEEEIGYHVHIMMEAGLVRAHDVTSMGDSSPQAIASSLTWAGHEFADASRDDSRWSTAKDLAVKKAGSVTVEVLTKLLSSLMTSALGL